jgi:hypothetical protein
MSTAFGTFGFVAEEGEEQHLFVSVIEFLENAEPCHRNIRLLVRAHMSMLLKKKAEGGGEGFKFSSFTPQQAPWD